MHASLSNCFIKKVEGSMNLNKTFSSLNLEYEVSWEAVIQLQLGNFMITIMSF